VSTLPLGDRQDVVPSLRWRYGADVAHVRDDELYERYLSWVAHGKPGPLIEWLIRAADLLDVAV